MKNKWWIVLFIFFLGVIILSLLTMRQNRQDILAPEKETVGTKRPERKVQAVAVYSPSVRKARLVTSPAGKSGITITKVPVKSAAEVKNSPVSKTTSGTSSSSVSLSASSVVEIEESPLPTGVTKAEQRSSSRNTGEANSSGIVLY